jgi:hypothetical protein
MLRGHVPLTSLVGGRTSDPIVTERLAEVLDVLAVATFLAVVATLMSPANRAVF